MPSEDVCSAISDCKDFNALIYFAHVHFPECEAFNLLIYIVHVHFPKCVAFNSLMNIVYVYFFDCAAFNSSKISINLVYKLHQMKIKAMLSFIVRK